MEVAEVDSALEVGAEEVDAVEEEVDEEEEVGKQIFLKQFEIQHLSNYLVIVHTRLCSK